MIVFYLFLFRCLRLSRIFRFYRFTIFWLPYLTLHDLVEITCISKHHLSQVINSTTDGNFYNYINSYRLNEFREMLLARKLINYTLLGIAYDCGFKSSSSFYSVIKKTTGKTPKEYADSLTA